MESSLGLPKRQLAEKTNRLLRWLFLAVVALSFPYSNGFGPVVITALVVAAAYNLVQSIPGTPSWWRAPTGGIVIDTLWLSAVVALSGGVTSPYLLFYLAPGFTAAYWYSWRGMVPVTLVQVGTLGLSALLQAQRPALRQLLVEGGALIAFELVVERIASADQRERGLTAQRTAQLESDQQRLLALINSLTSAVMVVDAAGRITLYNGATLELLDTNQGLNGQLIGHLIKLRDGRDRQIDLTDLIKRTAHLLERSDLVMPTSGGPVNLNLIISPIHLANSQSGASGSVILIRDITHEKTLDEQRDEFISVASHELRTPLAIAEANISTALLPKFDQIGAKARALIDQAHGNIVFLGQLIKDLTDLSLAETGKLKLDLAPLNSALLLEQLERDYRNEATSKGLELRVKTADHLPALMTSQHQVHEILQNFLTNAIKYTQKGWVELGAQVDASGQRIEFWVKDSGIGIAAEEQTHLFTKFYRSADARTRSIGGTGLGLYITRKLAELLHGKIWFESRLNHGSTFHLRVPSLQNPHLSHSTISSKQSP